MPITLQSMTESDFENYKKYSIKVYSQGMLDEKEYPNYEAAYASGYNEVTNFYKTLREGESYQAYNIMEETSHTIVGYLVFSYLIYNGQKIAFIDYIEIFPQFRRKGYAKRAMELMEEIVRKDGLPLIDLNVMLHKVGAQKLYASLG